MWGVDAFRSWWRHRSAEAATATTDLGVAPQDLEELSQAAHRVAGEFPLSAPEVIIATVGRLMRRQVPIRGIRGSVHTPGFADLCFADGTVITVRGEHHGDLGRLAIRLLHGRVLLESITALHQQVTIGVAYDDHRVEVLALGVRQPR